MNASATLLARLPADEAWPQLPAQAPAIPMQSPPWVRARAGLVHSPKAWHFMAVPQAGGLAALAPLVRVGHWLREPPAMFEPSDWLWNSPEALDRLAEGVARLRLPLWLERLPAESPTLPALRRAFAGRGWLRVRPAMPTPVIELGARWAQGGGDLSPRRHADFRRYERRAAARGPLHYELHAPTPGSGLQRVLAEALAVESRSWKQDTGTALTADARQGGFIASVVQAAAAAGTLRIALLRLGEQAVAMQIALQWRQRFWLLKISHDEACADCSPGQLLMRHTLAHAARQQLLSYEFMGGMDDWTRLWTRQTRHYLQVQALPLGAATALVLARGAAGHAHHLARRWLRRR
ncbi:MAG: GNAT family N-acetyltransferase [Burkholderiales bacterium]|nr:GNAT family N-acetyltransferase [Burkholderiales bacterium]